MRATALCRLTATVSVIGVFVSGCGNQGGGAGGVAGTLADLRPLAEKCDGPINGLAGIDQSASGADDQGLREERLDQLRDFTNHVAACGGHLKVVSFAASLVDTVDLGSQDFPTEFGTETARLIKADKLATALMDRVDEELSKSAKQVSPRGTDVLAQLELAREFQAQRQGGRLFIFLATDGIATSRPVPMNTDKFDVERASRTATEIAMPDLKGADVRLVGLGRRSEKWPPLPTWRVDALKTFYSTVCKRSGAANCLITSDYTKEG